MGFDREAAKAAGYSDAEIDAYLGGKSPTPGTSAARVASAGYSGAPDLPLQEAHPIEGAMALAGIPGLLRSVPAAIGAARAIPEMIGSAASRIGQAAGSPAAQDLMTLVEPRAGAGLRIAGRIAGKFAKSGTAAAAPEAAAAAPEAAPAVTKTLAEIKPLGPGATAEERLAQHIDLERAMAQEKLPDAAKRRILRAFGHEQQGTSASRIAGKIEPSPTGPKATIAEPQPGTAAARVKAAKAEVAAQESQPALLAKARPAGWDEPLSRHPHGYWSDTNQAKIAIETMSQNHLLNAIEKRTGELARWANPEKAAPVKYAELEALKKELAWRAEHGGVTIQGPRAGQGGH